MKDLLPASLAARASLARIHTTTPVCLSKNGEAIKEMGGEASAALSNPAPPPALPHVAILPFMSKGHTIPLLHLARLLHRRHLATFTIFTTPLNAPFILRSLSDVIGGDSSVVELPFPHDAPGMTPGVESTDQLPSLSLFLPFITALECLRPGFESALERHRPSFLISDGFCPWALEFARTVGVPSLVFLGMGAHAQAIHDVLLTSRPHAGVTSQSEHFSVPGFPGLSLTLADLPVPADTEDILFYEVVTRVAIARSESQGIIFNTFYEMEPSFVEYWQKHLLPQAAWCVGPLCLAQLPVQSLRQEYKDWLDARQAKNRPVLYVAFGTQVELPPPQLEELAAGLESSGLYFLWVLRSREGAVRDACFEAMAAGRGLIVREWVPQTEVLGHAAVRGFLSHCGWSSVLESVCAEVPILAWPMIAEQPLNARRLEEDLGVAIRLRAADGTRDGLVRRESIVEAARELLAGAKGREAAAKVAELAVAARKAMDEGGSSWLALRRMVDEVCGQEAAVPERVGACGPV